MMADPALPPRSPLSARKAAPQLLRRLGRLCSVLLWVWVAGLMICRPLFALPLPFWAGVWWLLRKRGSGSPWLSARLWFGALALVELGVFLCLRAPDAAWQLPWARVPQITRSGDTLHIADLRDFVYRSEDEYTVQYREEDFDLRTLSEVHLATCFWDGHTAICHTMLCFSFSDGRAIVISPETRLPIGQTQDALHGIYKCYGLLYVFGTVEDIFGLRTDMRREQLYIYPLRVSPAQARDLLLGCVRMAQATIAERVPYNTLTQNCSTGIFEQLRSIYPNIGSVRPVHNSEIVERLYRDGDLLTRPGESLESLRARCYVGEGLSPENRAAYTETLRRKLDLPPLPRAPGVSRE